MKLQLPKGTKDFKAEEMIVRNKIVATLKEIFEMYGYSPFETPSFERYEILSSKYAGGSEILKETFRFKDQGKRELCLRYDLTVPLARFIGMNPNTKMPFKRYQIGEVFRDGPIKAGRYREFWQCDVDIIGCKEMTADAEIVNMTLDIFKKLKIDIIIKVNNRRLLNSIVEYSGISKSKAGDIILTLDKLEKFGKQSVEKELKEKGVNQKSIDNLMKFMIVDRIEKDKRYSANEGLKEIKELFTLVKSKDVKFDPSLARGLAYYTGTVFEVFFKKGEMKSSLAAGGRYNKMIGNFLSSKIDYPAVGISFGLDVITDLIKQKEKKKTVTELYIIPIGTLKESLKIAKKLRNEGIKTDIDLIGRGPSKNLKYADSLNIPYVLFIGKEELKQKKVKLRDMESGKEKLVDLKGVIEII